MAVELQQISDRTLSLLPLIDGSLLFESSACAHRPGMTACCPSALSLAFSSSLLFMLVSTKGYVQVPLSVSSRSSRMHNRQHGWSQGRLIRAVVLTVTQMHTEPVSGVAPQKAVAQRVLSGNASCIASSRSSLDIMVSLKDGVSDTSIKRDMCRHGPRVA